MSWRLALKRQPPVRVDLRGVVPAVLAELAAGDVERLLVGHGNALVPLAEFFDVHPHDEDGTLILEGDLSRVDRIGWEMASGRLVVTSAAGHYAGGCMSGGTLHVQGDAGLLAACEMSGGTMTINGDVNDFAAAPLPGSTDGMRGGTLIVRGQAGQRFGDRMRRGTALVFGDVGDFAASRMVAGTIGIGGRAGAHAGFGMRRGSVVLATQRVEPPPTFVPAGADSIVFWQLLARDLAQHGGPFEGLATRRIQRYLGDLAFSGKGEMIAVIN